MYPSIASTVSLANIESVVDTMPLLDNMVMSRSGEGFIDVLHFVALSLQSACPANLCTNDSSTAAAHWQSETCA
jgi:hypothetical protein